MAATGTHKPRGPGGERRPQGRGLQGQSPHLALAVALAAPL